MSLSIPFVGFIIDKLTNHTMRILLITAFIHVIGMSLLFINPIASFLIHGIGYVLRVVLIYPLIGMLVN